MAQGVQGRLPKVDRKMMNAKWQGAKVLQMYGIAGPYRNVGQLSFLAMRRAKTSPNFDWHKAPLNSMAFGNPHLVVHMIVFVMLWEWRSGYHKVSKKLLGSMI